MKSEPDLTLPGLAHDLNNVFQTLVDVAFRLSEDPLHAEISSAILRSVERGHRITQSLFEGGSSARLTAIVASARGFVEESNPAISFLCDVDTTLEMRQGWAWERVLINLFLNSCRAMPEGGTIHVRAYRKPQGLAITVSDEGCGIPETLFAQIFAPHVSGSGSTGLGLHIVKGIVEQDGGSIEAANRTRGAEFRILLPASALAVPESLTARAGA